MTWNLRVMRRSEPGQTTFGIFEVYYDDDGSVVNWDSSVAAPFYCAEVDGEDWSLWKDYERFAEAFDKPILDWETGRPINVSGDETGDSAKEE